MIPITQIARDKKLDKWVMIVQVVRPGQLDGFKKPHLIEITKQDAQLLLDSYQHEKETCRFFDTYTFNAPKP